MVDRLFIYATAPAEQRADGLWLDQKFVQGMRRHVAEWPGPVTCVLRQSGQPMPFGMSVPPESLEFELVILSPDAAIAPHLGRDVALVAAAADDHSALDLAAHAHAMGAKIVFSLEYTLETRLRIVWMDKARSVVRRVWSSAWNLRQELRRRHALKAADGVQFNGYAAHDRYAKLTQDSLLYLDNRLSADMMATADEMAKRATRLREGAPLRLIHSGRLEPMKGAQDLIPVMEALGALGISATLDIYGTGSLEGAIRADLPRLQGRVRLHEPVDFARELVRINRRHADAFLSCHRQSDPSCSYLEAMGCGLAVAGYDNHMWRPLQAQSRGGVVTAMGDVAAQARAIAAWDRNREDLIDASARARAFAQDHDFESVFAARMAHLRKIAGVGD